MVATLSIAAQAAFTPKNKENTKKANAKTGSDCCL
jgi:hypothetical protein